MEDDSALSKRIGDIPIGSHGSSWATWACSFNPEMPRILQRIDAKVGRLELEISDGFRYQHVLQAQINHGIDQLSASGAMSKETIESPYGPSRKITGRPTLPKDFVAAHFCNNGTAPRMLETLSFAKRLTVLRLLAGVRSDIASDDLIVPFLCLRGILEQVATYHVVIAELRTIATPGSFEEANRQLGPILKLLNKKLYGTRVDWQSLAKGDDIEARIDRGKIKYKKEENRADREAEGVMNDIDALSKQVKGTRGVYEILCEFAHPNVGFVLASAERAEPVTDTSGVVWVRKQLGAGPPLAFLEATGASIARAFKQCADCLDWFEHLLGEGATRLEKVRGIAQMVIRRLISSQPKLLNVYDPCPCGSGNKIRFCCGSTKA